MNSMSTFKFAVGVCAFNEEKNIRSLLQNLISEQKLPEDCRVIIVCSGCTDRTLEIVREFSRKDKRFVPIIEKTRKGKANALNTIFKSAKESADVLVLVNADALPKPRTIPNLVSELEASKAGVVFAQPVPLDGPDGISYRIVRVIWRLHHLISVIRSPKLQGSFVRFVPVVSLRFLKALLPMSLTLSLLFGGKLTLFVIFLRLLCRFAVQQTSLICLNSEGEYGLGICS
jgi:glycosyltransferase involved in cell wall biosynthesis